MGLTVISKAPTEASAEIESAKISVVTRAPARNEVSCFFIGILLHYYNIVWTVGLRLCGISIQEMGRGVKCGKVAQLLCLNILYPQGWNDLICGIAQRKIIFNALINCVQDCIISKNDRG